MYSVYTEYTHHELTSTYTLHIFFALIKFLYFFCCCSNLELSKSFLCTEETYGILKTLFGVFENFENLNYKIRHRGLVTRSASCPCVSLQHTVQVYIYTFFLSNLVLWGCVNSIYAQIYRPQSAEALTNEP